MPVLGAVAIPLLFGTIAPQSVQAQDFDSDASGAVEDPTGRPFGFLGFGRRSSPTNLPPLTVGTAAYRHEFEADFDEMPGEMSIDDISLLTPLPPLSWDQFHLVSFFSYRGTWIDGSGSPLIPDDDLHGFRLPIAFLHDVSESVLWGAMVMPGYSSDLSGGSSDEAWSISAAIGAGYAWSPSLRVFAGAFYSHGVNDDDFVVPGIAFTWRPHPDWETYLLPPLAGISYSVSETWKVGIFGRYDSTAWYVDASDAGEEDGVATTIRGMRVGLKVEGHLANRFWLYGAGGYSFARELEVERVNGRSLLDEDIEPGPFIQFGINYRF